jgi:Predicted S-adenosylmethionine-dependent methyltransferase involved in cell envelope biogenesis
MKKICEYAHSWIKEYVKENDVVVDFTMGNGHDTLVLSQIVNKGQVFAFDIQSIALENTKNKLDKYNIKHVALILDGHENIDSYLSKFKAGIFNLGYLPSGNKTITTKKDTTILAIRKALDLLEVKGLLALVVYPGHLEGREESKAILSFVCCLDNHDYDVAKFSLENKKDAPYIIFIEKLRAIIS